MTIKETLRGYILQQEAGTRLFAKHLWWDLFHYKVARNSVTRALNELAKEGLIERSLKMRGRNSEWKRLD